MDEGSEQDSGAVDETTDTETALDALVREGHDDLFTAAAVAIGSSDGLERSVTVGTCDPDRSVPVTDESLFDCASVTKAAVTTPVVLNLVEEGVLALSDPIEQYLDPLAGTERGAIPLERFLTHTTGLIPYYYDETWECPEAARRDIYELDLLDPDGQGSYEYSCLNFVHLVAAARAATGESLASLARQYAFDPAGMSRARLGPVEDDSLPVVVTRERDYLEADLQGEIHDPIARALDGESGNAGLFATATDLAALATALLNDGAGDVGQVLAPSTIHRMRAAWLSGDQRPHGLGWRRAMDHYPGTTWSRESFGHTGYTGTSLWLDPEFDRFAVLLTNEVYCGKERGMIRFRERFHNVVGAGRF